MSEDFDPSTAYANRWKYMRFVENVTWERKNETNADDKTTGCKARRLDLTSRRDQELAASIGITVDEQGWQWWPGENQITTEPKQRDVIREEASEKAGWVIQRVQRFQRNFWIIATVKEVLNVV